MTLLGSLKKGLVFVISAPAGTGKTTLVRMLLDEFDSVLESVSYTTRQPRPKEIEGRDYHFVTEAQFEEMIAKGEFLEYARVFGNYYGTSKKWVEEERERGKHVILIIDTQGAMQLKKKMFDAVYIFLQPPNLDELQKRLCGRQSDSREAIETRLSWAQKEMGVAKNYDYQIVNENLKEAYEILRSIFIAEDHKIRLK